VSQDLRTIPPNAQESPDLALTWNAERDVLATILDSVDAGIYVSDMETHELLFVNESFRQVFGDIVGRACWSVLQRGQTGPCSFCTNSALIDAQGLPTAPVVWKHHNLLVDRWYEVRDRAIRWRDGRIVRLEIATDITAQHAVEVTLLESVQKLRDITRVLGEGVYVLDAERRATFVNPKASELLGWTAEEMIGRDMHALVHHCRPNGDCFPAQECGVLRVFETGVTYRAHEDYYLRKDGRFVPVAHVTAAIVRDGRIIGTVSAFHDITARRVAEAEQARLIAELQDALANIKTLKGLLPVCAWCKKIRDDDGYWQQVDVYLQQHAAVEITHGLCAECATGVMASLERDEEGLD
jgi:PAS domain S-box-containing protein